MGMLLRKMTEVFLDTSFAIALSATTDQSHARAVDLADQLEKKGTRLVTTQAILLEIGNALSKQRYRIAAIQLLESLASDPNVLIWLNGRATVLSTVGKHENGFYLLPSAIFYLGD
jgi:uncharacterized protein